MSERVVHPLAPIFDHHSSRLILGSLPSVASRREGFYYMHPRNRFWPLMEILFQVSIPGTPEGKRNFLLENGIALWDVVQSCEIDGSSDASIQKPVVNDLRPLVRESSLQRIYTNGKKADQLYRRWIHPQIKIPSICLSSTSPANAAYSLARLAREWQLVREAG